MITDIRFRPYDPKSQAVPREDIIGWVSLVFHGLFLNNIMVKRLPDGKVILTYPRYVRGTNERTNFYFNPANRETREVLDRVVLEHIQGVSYAKNKEG